MKYIILILSIVLFSCKKDDGGDGLVEDQHMGYPKAVGEIILNKCATVGCHNDASRQAAAGLSLSTWERMFEGTTQNSVVIPYRADQSILQFFINTYDDLGPIVEPTMPYNAPPLSREEVITIRDWINNGAPRYDGYVKYSDNGDIPKYYVLNSKCKLVAVFNANTNKIMRYIDIPAGENDFVESIRTSGDKKYWYVLLTTGKILRFDGLTDTYVDALDLGSGLWRGLSSIANQELLVCNYSGNTSNTGGEVVIISTNTFTEKHRFNLPQDSIYFPYSGIAHDGFYYVSAHLCNFIYKIGFDGTVSRIMLDDAEQVKYNDATYRPGDITLLWDGNIAVACQASNEVRIFDRASGVLKKVVNVGAFPNEMLAHQKLLLVTCTEDEEAFPGNKGSLYVYNTSLEDVETILDVGYQPKGITRSNNLILVANRNADPVGADKPHHYSGCEGNNGYVTALGTTPLIKLKGFRAEVSVDPYSIAY